MTELETCASCGRRADPGSAGYGLLPVLLTPVLTPTGDKLVCSLACAVRATERGR